MSGLVRLRSGKKEQSAHYMGTDKIYGMAAFRPSACGKPACPTPLRLLSQSRTTEEPPREGRAAIPQRTSGLSPHGLAARKPQLRFMAARRQPLHAWRSSDSAPGRRNEARVSPRSGGQASGSKRRLDRLAVNLYLRLMKTTVELPESVVRKAKLLAAERQTTLRALVLKGLEHVLMEEQVNAKDRAKQLFAAMDQAPGIKAGKRFSRTEANAR